MDFGFPFFPLNPSKGSPDKGLLGAHIFARTQG